MADAFIGYEEPGGKRLGIPLKNMRRHFFALGSSGSGKTVLCKALLEEGALNGIPSIAVDPQGDLASLILMGDAKDLEAHGLDPALAKGFHEKARVTIFTPISSKGIPICLNPLEIDDIDASDEEIIPILHQISSSIIKLLGYIATNDKGKAAETIIYSLLKRSFESSQRIGTFDALADLLSNMDEKMKIQIQPFITGDKEVEELIRKIKFLTIGEKELLFNFGVPLDIDMLLGKGKHAVAGKTQVSVIYLNTLTTPEEKEFFVSILTTKLYQWMLEHPSDGLNCMYFVDEIAPFIPAGSEKPIPKPILMLLFKQARKYGVSCIIATQNPGDIDYKAFAQFGTWAIGRLSVKQDQKKVENALKAMTSADISQRLPALTPGQFLLFSPDLSQDIIGMRSRWLMTSHKTLTDIDVKNATPQALRDSYQQFTRKSIKKRKLKQEAEPKKEKKPPEKEQEERIDEPHFPLKVTEADLVPLFEKLRKKSFLLGPVKERVAGIELRFRPIIILKVAEAKRFLWKVSHYEYQVLVDGVTGGLIVFRDNDFRNMASFSKLLELDEKAIAVLKSLGPRKRLFPAEIMLKAGLSKGVVSSSLKTLAGKKLASFERAGKDMRFFSTIDLPATKVSKVSSEGIRLGQKTGQGTTEKVKIDHNDLETAIREWFDSALVVEQSIAYLPIYKARFKGKTGERIVQINGMTGGILED